MATALGTRTSWPALSEHKRLRFTTIFLLYVAQGLPIGVFQFAVPAWLAANGASAAAVGTVVSAATLPWSLKLIHGFLMDRWAYLPMGRRRAWLITAQLLIVLTLLALAMAGAGPSEILLLAAFAFAANLFTTVQDVAIDGMAIDLIPVEEQARANGFMFGGQALGIAIGTSLTGYALFFGGVPLAAILNAVIVGALLAMILVLRERPGEKLLPWHDGEPSAHSLGYHAGAWRPIMVGVFHAMARRDTLLFIAGPFFSSMTLGIYYGLAPLLGTRELGWSDADVSAMNGMGSLLGAVVAVLFTGVIADRLGAKRTAIGVYALILALALAMWGARAHWGAPGVFTAFMLIFLVLDTSTRVCGCAVSMRLCTPSVAATQFGLFMAIGNFGTSAGAAMIGTLEKWGGLDAMLIAMAVAAGLGILCLLLARVGR